MKKIIFTTLLLCVTLKASYLPEVSAYSVRKPMKPSQLNALEPEIRQARPFKVVYKEGIKGDYFDLYVEGDLCLSGLIHRTANNFNELNTAYCVRSLEMIAENLKPKTVNVLRSILERGRREIGYREINENDAFEELLNDWLDIQKNLIEHEIVGKTRVKKGFDSGNMVEYKDPRFNR